MAGITVRNLSEKTKQRLRIRAAANGRSMEAETRAIIENALATPRSVTVVPGNLADAIAAIVDPIGGIEFELPPRALDRPPPDFNVPDSEDAA